MHGKRWETQMSIDPSFIPATPGAPLGAVPVPLPQIPAPGAPRADADAAAEGVPLFDGEGFSFSDVLDLINPLQHLPVISTLYRDLTGDEIGAGARVLGGALFGGIPGVVSSLINVVIEDETGKDFGEHVLALFDDPAGEASNTAYAAVDRFDITPGTKGARTRSAAPADHPAPATTLAAAPSTGAEAAYAAVDRFDITPGTKGARTRSAAPADHPAPAAALAAAPSTGAKAAAGRLAAGKANWDRTAPATTLMADNQVADSLYMADVARDVYRTAATARGGAMARTGRYA